MAQSHFLMGYALCLLGDATRRDEALVHFQTAARLGHHRALRYGAEWCFRGQQYEQASKLYEQLSELEAASGYFKASEAALDMSSQCQALLQKQDEPLEDTPEPETNIEEPVSASVSDVTVAVTALEDSEPSDIETIEEVKPPIATPPTSTKKKKRKRRSVKALLQKHLLNQKQHLVLQLYFNSDYAETLSGSQYHDSI